MKLGRSKKPWLVGLAVVMILMLAAAGCGTGSTSTASQTPTQAPTSTPAPAANPLAGKTITFIVPYSPGGGFDQYARLMQPYLEKATGATVVVQNVPGGGSIIGSNNLYNAKPDGTTIGILSGGSLVFAQTAGADGVKFDVGKYTYLGRVSQDPSVLLVSTKKPFKSIADVAKSTEQLKFAVTGVGEDDFYTFAVLAKAFGISNYKMVTGWEGTSQWLSAVGAGQLDGGPISLSSALPPIQNKIANPMIQVAPKRDSRLPDVPTALEALPADSPNKTLIQTITNVLVADRVIAAPPGMDPALTKAMRDAIDKVLKDPEFTQKAEQAKRPVLYMSGQDVQQAVTDAMKSAQSLKPIFDEAVAKAK